MESEFGWSFCFFFLENALLFLFFPDLPPFLPHSRTHLERLMGLVILWRQSLGIFFNLGVRLTCVCVYIMIIRDKQSFLSIIYIQKYSLLFSYMHTGFDTLISDLTECLNFSLVYCEMQYLDFLGILQDHFLNSLWHLKNKQMRRQ